MAKPRKPTKPRPLSKVAEARENRKTFRSLAAGVPSEFLGQGVYMGEGVYLTPDGRFVTGD